MYFETFGQLLAMDGHGAYVWSVVLLSFGAIAWLLMQPVHRYRRQLRDIARGNRKGGF